jgi:hypothetical protein
MEQCCARAFGPEERLSLCRANTLCWSSDVVVFQSFKVDTVDLFWPVSVVPDVVVEKLFYGRKKSSKLKVEYSTDCSGFPEMSTFLGDKS